VLTGSRIPFARELTGSVFPKVHRIPGPLLLLITTAAGIPGAALIVVGILKILVNNKKAVL
jgi:hypothetical protein